MSNERRPIARGWVTQLSLSNGGVPKRAVSTAVVTVAGIVGDRQKHRKIHGGPSRALCLYAQECVDALRAEGHSIAPGAAGENVTIAGLTWTSLSVGDRVRIGAEVELEITGYAAPCRANGQWFSNGDYHRMSQDRHPGWSRLYVSVLQGGTIHHGDAVEHTEVRVNTVQAGHVVEPDEEKMPV